MKNKMKAMPDKYLLMFFVCTLLWTWTCGFIPVIFDFTGTPVGTFLFYFGGGAPSVVALFLVFFTYSKDEQKDYFHRCFSFKYMGWKWPLITICAFSVITIISLFIGVGLLGYEMPGMDFVNAIIKNPLILLFVLLISLVSGPLNEEFGWRGYALDKLLVKYGFLGSSAILGFVWGIWHLAWYFTPGQAQYNLLQDSVIDAVMYIPSVVLLNFWVTFVYIKTKRSILAGALVHMFGNLLGSQILSPYTTEISMTIRYTKMLFFMIIILYAIFSKKFKNEVAEQIKEISSDKIGNQ
ncbi:MAG: type II CAAX endopeptidase family protein [Acutalibacteraceae bacterium]|nr:type II CAAX endopeptidase family protein [Acutalibacteraceae bacterium]